MIRYYSNRKLAEVFQIKLAKWKRWSRAFLPPDPLGGYRSGYARQYSLYDAFTVYLGGYLVAELNFTLPESERILQDLNRWLEDHGFLFSVATTPASVGGAKEQVRSYRIDIVRPICPSGAPAAFQYRICGVISSHRKPHTFGQIVTETYLETAPFRDQDSPTAVGPVSIRVLEISDMHRYFCDRLKI